MIVELLKTSFADTFAFYLKAQNYHWNIEGANFPQYHAFLGDLYQEVYSSVDTMAELIRTLDSYAPGTLARLKALTTIEESELIPGASNMIIDLMSDNQKVLASLYLAYKQAEDEGQAGVANFIQDRIQAHEKHSWMLRAINK